MRNDYAIENKKIAHAPQEVGSCLVKPQKGYSPAVCYCAHPLDARIALCVGGLIKKPESSVWFSFNVIGGHFINEDSSESIIQFIAS